MKKITAVFLLLTFISSITIISCKKDEEKPSFDREAMLINYADNIILPELYQFQKDNDQLNATINTLANTVTKENLASVREAYMTTIFQWENINYLNFGPGAREGLKLSIAEEFALFPIAEEMIEDKITQNNFLLDDGRRFTRGLLSIEYLLYAQSDLENTLATFDENRQAYLKAISDKLKTQVDEFIKAWETYTPIFKSATGTDLKGSTTLLYNEWIRSYELLKNMKIVEPMGLKAGSSGPNIDLVESRFAKISLDLARAHFENLITVYNGGSGSGIDDYVRSVDGGEEQVQATIAQIEKVRGLFDGLPSGKSLQELINENSPELDILQKEMQVLLPKLKSEVSSMLGLTITYSTGDGD